MPRSFDQFANELWGPDPAADEIVIADQDAPITHRAKDVRTPFHGKPMESHTQHQDKDGSPKE